MKRKAELASQLTELYRELIGYPTPTAGKILKSSPGSSILKVSSLWSQRNLEQSKITTSLSSYEVDTTSKAAQQIGRSCDVSNEQLFALSPSERLHCIVRRVTDSESNKNKQFLEIWKDVQLWRNFDLGALDLHGDVNTSGTFGSLEWSPSEQYVAYIAEKKRPKSEPFYKQSKAKKPAADGEETVQGEEFTFVEDWGEQLVGISQTVIAVCDVQAGTIRILEGIPGDFCPGDVTWSADSASLYGTAFDTSQRRLGLIYCTNRASVIFNLSLKGEYAVVSETGQAVFSPRLNPDGTQLVWLQRAVGGPHDGGKKLMKLDISTNQVTVVVDLVEKGSSEKSFYGITSQDLPRRCFLKGGGSLIFNSTKIDKNRIYSVQIDSGEVSEITAGVALDVLEDEILLTKSSPTSTPRIELLLGSSSTSITQSFDVFPPDTTSFKRISIGEDNNAMLFMPTAGENGSIPLIVFPHGGPHSVISDSYMFEPAFFVRLGFAILLVNYRGSTGNGESSLNELPGNVGDLDVKDVHELAKKALAENPQLSSSKVIAYGGSHGGFLSLHLVGQYPGFYQTAVVRNPVVDLPPMFLTSDIPDWVSVESGSSYPVSADPSLADFTAMWEKSPMRHVGSITASVLFLIGSVDLRVPPSQSLHLYKVLKARGVNTKLLLYPKDSHPLSSVSAHIDSLINGTLWMYEAIGHTEENNHV